MGSSPHGEKRTVPRYSHPHPCKPTTIRDNGGWFQLRSGGGIRAGRTWATKKKGRVEARILANPADPMRLNNPTQRKLLDSPPHLPPTPQTVQDHRSRARADGCVRPAEYDGRITRGTAERHRCDLRGDRADSVRNPLSL